MKPTNDLDERTKPMAADRPDNGSPAADYEVLRRRHLQEMRTLAPGHLERLS